MGLVLQSTAGGLFHGQNFPQSPIICVVFQANSMSNLPPIPPPDDDVRTDLIALLDEFDPKRHGGEAMAFAPAGREFGSPDHERLAMGLGDPEAL